MKQNSMDIKHNKLLNTHKNNIIISDMNLDNKFTHFEDSKLNKSKTLLYEVEKKPIRYKRYSRGSIIKVRFGVNVDSEFSGDHYAIVVSKGDTMMSPTLHVIPITSKKHKKNIDIGNILYSKNEISKLTQLLEKNGDKNKKKIQKCIDYYSKRKDIISYACVDHLRTISKLSICKGLNEFDFINNLKCSNKIMKKIDKEIAKEYTI